MKTEVRTQDPDLPLPYTLLVKGRHWYFRHRKFGTIKIRGDYRSPVFMRHYHKILRQHGLIPEFRKVDTRDVYFVAWEGGPIKIGISRCNKGRLYDLQNACPYELKVLAGCRGGRMLEAAYHRRFAKYRIRGEWFERCPEIEAEIARLTNA